jgi:hypothetical protein
MILDAQERLPIYLTDSMHIHIHVHPIPALKSLAVAALDPLELLDTDQAVITHNSQCVDQLIWTVHLSNGPCALLAGLLSRLDGNNLSSLKIANGLHISAISGGLIKLHTNRENINII